MIRCHGLRTTVYLLSHQQERAVDMLIRYDLFSPGHGLVFRVLDLHRGDLRSIHAQTVGGIYL